MTTPTETTTMTTNDTLTPCPGLAVYRTAAGLTQPELAARIHRSRRTLQRYEDTGQAPLDVLQVCAQALGVPLESLTEPGGDCQTVRDLARAARRYREALKAIREAQGPEGYRAAVERLEATQPDLADLIPW